jgi:hypothetical protein
MKHPDTQLVPLQISPAPQLVPLAAVLQAEVLVPGWQLWQALLGFDAPDAKTIPPMSHWVPHSPLAQT